MAYPPAFPPQKTFNYSEKRMQRCQYGINNSNSYAFRNNNDFSENDCSTPMRLSSSAEKKCPVYVHRFNKIPNKSLIMQNLKGGNEMHPSMYKHEYSDYYDAKINCFRKQFDDLSLASKHNRISNTLPAARKSNQRSRKTPPDPYSSAISQSKARINKSFVLKPEHKAVVDKLEETYWAKWKPSKDTQILRASCPKTKGLYTENEKINDPDQVFSCTVNNEKGDSNEAIPNVKFDSSNSNLVETSSAPLIQEEYSATNDYSQEQIPEILQNEEPEKLSEANDMGHEAADFDNDEGSFRMPSETNSECNVNSLKHTDSFILNSRKHKKGKSPYQQPKCIKLFKNAGYTTSGNTNYIKGGSYPLKSCLKKESSGGKSSSRFGRPGSNMLTCSVNRRHGKANRFT